MMHMCFQDEKKKVVGLQERRLDVVSQVLLAG